MEKKLFYPCRLCVHGGTCKAKVYECKHWDAWFRAYWAGLRAKYL